MRNWMTRLKILRNMWKIYFIPILLHMKPLAKILNQFCILCIINYKLIYGGCHLSWKLKQCQSEADSVHTLYVAFISVMWDMKAFQGQVI